MIVHYGGYAANASVEKLAGAFLIGRDGNDKLIRNRLRAYDLSNKALRDWWISAVEDVCSDPSIDGVFLDGVVKVLEPVFLKRVITPEKNAAELAGYSTMMADTRKNAWVAEAHAGQYIESAFLRFGTQLHQGLGRLLY